MGMPLYGQDKLGNQIDKKVGKVIKVTGAAAVSLSASDGITDSQTNVTVIWQDVNVDDHGIYIKVKDSASGEYSDSEYSSFTVEGLPDLIITNVETLLIAIPGKKLQSYSWYRLR